MRFFHGNVTSHYFSVVKNGCSKSHSVACNAKQSFKKASYIGIIFDSCTNNNTSKQKMWLFIDPMPMHLTLHTYILLTSVSLNLEAFKQHNIETSERKLLCPGIYSEQKDIFAHDD